MNETIRTLWRTNRLLVIAFAVAVSFTILFGLRMAVFYGHRPPPDGEIAGWMTVRHIARANHIDPEVVHDALGLEPGLRDRRPIARIAHDRGVPLDELVSTVQDAVDKERDERGPRP